MINTRGEMLHLRTYAPADGEEIKALVLFLHGWVGQTEGARTAICRSSGSLSTFFFAVQLGRLASFFLAGRCRCFCRCPQPSVGSRLEESGRARFWWMLCINPSRGCRWFCSARHDAGLVRFSLLSILQCD